MKKTDHKIELLRFSPERKGSCIVEEISKYNVKNASNYEINEFIGAMSWQLVKLATETGNEFLAYLLTMAAQEAKLATEQPDAPRTASAG